MTLAVLLAGATGLVGSEVAERLRARPDITLTSLVRTARTPADRVTDFEALVASPATALPRARVDIGISCLGTTIRKAGSQAAFRRVDHDYVLAVARAARTNGARQFILVSSVGAGGSSFYLRVKGEVEAGLRMLGFERLDILRPSLLLGPRDERRPAEALAQRAAPILNPLLLGTLSRYKALPGSRVAAAITAIAGQAEPGVRIYHTGEIERAAG